MTAIEADISVPMSESITEQREQDRCIVDQATIISISKLAHEEKIQVDAPTKPLTLEGENFLTTPSAGGVQSDIDITLPEASKVAEKPGQPAKDDPENLLGNLQSSDQLLNGIQKDAEESNDSDKNGGRSIAVVVEGDKSENLNVQVNTVNDEIGDGKTTEEYIPLSLTDDAPKEGEYQISQNKMTTEEEPLGTQANFIGDLETSAESSRERSVDGELQGNGDSQGDVEIEHKTLGDNVTEHGNPNAAEKAVDGMDMEHDQQLEKESEKLPVKEVSTGSINGNESSVSLDVRDENKDLQKYELFTVEKNKNTLAKEELQMENPSESLHAEPENKKASYSAEDTEEKVIDAAETQKEDIENVSKEETKENSMIEADVSQMKIEGLSESGKTSLTTSAREANDDELMVRHEAKNEDGQLRDAELCKNEEHTESTLPQIESKTEKEEDTQYIASEEIQVSNLAQEVEASALEEQSLTEDPQGILDEKTDDKTVNAAIKEDTHENATTFGSNETNKEKLTIHFDGLQTKDQEHLKRESEKPPFTQDLTENAVDDLSLKDEIKIENEHIGAELFEKEESIGSISLMDEGCTGKPENQQAVLDDKTEEKTIDAAATNQTPQNLQENVTINVSNEDNVKNSLIQVDGQQMKHEAHLEKEKMPIEASSEKHIQTADPQEISSEKTEEEITEVADTEESIQDAMINVLSRDNEDTSLMVEDGSQQPSQKAVSTCKASDDESTKAKFEDDNFLKAELVKSEKFTTIAMDQPSTEASSEKQIQMTDPQEISSEKTKEEITEVADIKEESTKDIATNVPDHESADILPIVEDGSQKPSHEEISICKATDDEPTKLFKAKFEDDNSLQAELVEDEKCTATEIVRPSIEASIEDQIQTADSQDISSDKTEVADTKEEITKDIATNVPNREYEDTIPAAEDGSQRPSQEEISVCKASDDEPTKMLEQELDDNASKTELVETEKCTEKEMENSSTEASSETQIQTADPQEISSNKIKEEITGIEDTKEECTKDVAINVSNQRNEDISLTAGDEPSLKEASTCKGSDNEPGNTLDSKFEENFPEAKSLENEISTIKEETPIESLDLANEDVKSFASGHDRETSFLEEQSLTANHQGIHHDTEDKTDNATGVLKTPEDEQDNKRNVSNEDNREISPFKEDGSQKPSLEEASTGKDDDDKSTTVHEVTLAEENTVKHDLITDDQDAECKLVKEEVSMESLPVPGNDIEAVTSIKETETSYLEEQSTATTTRGIIGDIKEDKAISGTEMNAEETPQDKDVKTTVTHEDTEGNSLAQADVVQHKHLEKVLENTSKVEVPTGYLTESTLAKEESEVDNSTDSLRVDNKDIELPTSGQEPETSTVEEQITTLDLQEISIAKREEETSDATCMDREILNEQNITNATSGENEIISPVEVDDLQDSTLKEISTGNTKENNSALIHETKFEDNNTITAEINERSTDGTSGKEEGTIEHAQMVAEDAIECASVQESEKTSSIEEESLKINSEGIIYDPIEDQYIDKMDLKIQNPETKNIAVTILQEVTLETSLVQEDFKHGRHLEKENETPSLTEPPKEDTTMLKEEVEVKCIDSLKVPNEAIQDEETSPTKEQISAPDSSNISRAITKENITEATQRNEEIPVIKDIATDVSGKDTEDNSHVKLDTSKKPSLEETMKSNDSGESTIIHETNTLQECQKAQANIIAETDLQVSEVAEDATENKCIEQLEKDDTTKCLLGAQKHTESGQEERECEQEKILLDEIEDIKESTSTPAANDFLPKSAETSKVYHNTSKKELTIDREDLHAGTKGNGEGVNIYEDKDTGEEASKQEISDYSHASMNTTEVRDQSITGVLPDAPVEDSTSKLPGDGQDEESISVEKNSALIYQYERDESEHQSTGSMVEETTNTNKVVDAHSQDKIGFESENQVLENIVQERSCDIITKAEEAKKDEEELKAAAEIHNHNVLSEHILSEKSKGEDENVEYHHLGSQKEGVTTGKQLDEDANQEEIKTEEKFEIRNSMDETKQVPKDFEGAAGENVEQQEENLPANESFDRSLHQNELEKSIEEVTTIVVPEKVHQVDGVYVETKNEDSKEGKIIIENHPDDKVNKEEVSTGETCDAKKDANETEKVTREFEEAIKEPEVNFLAKESNDRDVDQNGLGTDITQVARILDAEKTRGTDHLYTENKGEDSREGIITGSLQEHYVNQEELKTDDISEVKDITNETVKACEVSEDSVQKAVQEPEENFSANVDGSTEDVVYIVNTEGIHEEGNVHTETKAEDSREKVSEVFDETVEKVEQGPEENLSDNVDRSPHQTELDKSISEFTTILSSEEVHKVEHINIERIENAKDEIATESQPKDEVKREEIINTGEKYRAKQTATETEKESKVSEEAMQEPEEDIIANVSNDRSLHQKEPEKSIEEATAIVDAEEAHGTREGIIAESYPVYEVKQQEMNEKEICEVKEIADEPKKESKVIEEAMKEPEEDIVANESIDRSLPSKELETSIEEAITTIDAEAVHGANQIYPEAKTEDSRDKMVAGNYPECDVKQQEINQKEICEVKNIADETLEVSRGIEEVAEKAVHEPEKILFANADTSLQPEDPEKSIEQITTLLDNEQVHGEDNVHTITSTETESQSEETCEVKTNATEVEKESNIFQEDAEMNAPQCEENLLANVDGTQHHNGEGKSAEEVAPLLNTEKVHAEVVDLYIENRVADLREKGTESRPEDEASSDFEKTIEEVVQAPKDLGKEIEVVAATLHTEKVDGLHPVHVKAAYEESKEEVSNDVEKITEKAVPEPEALGQGIEVITATIDTEKTHGVHPKQTKECLEESKQDVTSFTAAFTEDEVHTATSDEVNSQMTNDECQSVSIGATAESPERLDKNIICEAAATNTIQKTSDDSEGKKENADAIIKELQEVEGKNKHENVPLNEITLGKEGEKLDQKDEICHPNETQAKDEENQMLSGGKDMEDILEADTHGKPTQDDYKNTDVEAENNLSSHANDTSGVSNNAETSRPKIEEYSNEGTESLTTTAGEEIELLEKASKPTKMAAAMPETAGRSDPCDPLEETEVGSQQEEEVSNKSKGIAQSSTLIEPAKSLTSGVIQEDTKQTLLEAEDQHLNLNNLPQESCAHDSETNTAQIDGSENLHSVRDINVDVQKLNECSVGVPIQVNPVDSNPNEVPSNREQAKATQNVTEPEVTPLSAKDKHVVRDVDHMKTMNPEDSTGDKDISVMQHADSAEGSRSGDEIVKPSHFKQDQARCGHEETEIQATTKSMEKPEMKDIDKPSLSDLFQATTKETMQMADDTVPSEEPTVHNDEQLAEHNDNDDEHDHAKSGEEKDGDEEPNEKGSDVTYEAPVMVDAGDTEVKVAHKKSHNILSGVGSKVKHSISKVKKAITGKSSHHPKSTSPK